ncbi:unnamed protein product [Moneuplotes crassus]|uniref:Uncharacterized protein n=1 Tax=Euplotes crassus TaxID=5936 RepID=A0AAD2CXQ4_EUPCR|nr:unnamed protein product [Moneuplotes crassus]
MCEISKTNFQRDTCIKNGCEHRLEEDKQQNTCELSSKDQAKMDNDRRQGFALRCLKGSVSCSNSSSTLAQAYTSYRPSMMKSKGVFKLRDSLRLVRKYLLYQFKHQNSEIVSKRYFNCSCAEIAQRITATLNKLLPPDIVTVDLVYYTIGILSLKDLRYFDCSSEVKQQVRLFLDAVRKFSFAKFKQVMASRSVQVLCRYLVLHSDDPRAVRLKEALNMD